MKIKTKPEANVVKLSLTEKEFLALTFWMNLACTSRIDDAFFDASQTVPELFQSKNDFQRTIMGLTDGIQKVAQDQWFPEY